MENNVVMAQRAVKCSGPPSRYAYPKRHPKRRWPRTNTNVLVESASFVNRFAILDVLGDKESIEALTTQTENAPLQPKQKKKGKLVVNVDQRVKKVVLSPVYTTHLEILFPPVRVTSVHGAKKAAAMRLGGWVGTKEGPAKIVYGSYEDGVFQA